MAGNVMSKNKWHCLQSLVALLRAGFRHISKKFYAKSNG